MKRYYFSFTSILFAVFALALTGCGDGAGGGDGKLKGLIGTGPVTGGPNPTSYPGYLGETLTLSGRVYTSDWEYYYYIPYTGENLTVNSNAGATGVIIDGQLSFTAGTPPTVPAAQVFSWLNERYNNVQISPSNTQCMILEMELSVPNSYESGPYRGKNTHSTSEDVSYIYTDRNVTVSGLGKTFLDWGNIYTSSNLNLNLNKGWSALYCKEDWTLADSATINVTLDNPPHLYWKVNIHK